MTSSNGKLYAATTENRLWRRYPVGANIIWKEMGHADNVVALAADGDDLLAASYGGDKTRFWRRSLEEKDIEWTLIGELSITVKAMTAASKMLYVVDEEGNIYMGGIREKNVSFFPHERLGKNEGINCLAIYKEIIFATTEQNRLLRTNTDFISESTDWEDIHHANQVTGLAILDNMLFAATEENKLWWMDILHF